MTILIPALCRAGRALVDWTQEELAIEAGVCRSTVREFENGNHDLQRAKADAIVEALQNAGVEFLSNEGAGPGVRLKVKKTVFR